MLQQTNVTTVDTQYVLQNRKLPDLAATASQSLGLEYGSNTTNYRLNPRRGSELNLFIVGGTKRITPSTEISELKDPASPEGNFSYLYDSLELKTYQFRVKVAAARYFSMGRSTVFKLGLNAATYESGNFFRNELFQIGGFKLLRGFDEESIFARRYAVLTTELRLLSGRNSYFFGFADGGYAQYKDLEQQFDHIYIGAGLGMVLETKNSLINISWAIGKRDDLTLDFRQSKIHLGIINFF
jgi:outer membrane protein assembly factor BamA